MAVTSPEIDKIAAALAIAQGAFKNPAKDRQNPHFKNRYATLDSAQTATRSILAENGLAVVQTVEDTENYLRLCTRLIHASGQWIESTIPLYQAAKGPQAFGSEIKYMRRYAYEAILNIAADEDDDGEDAQTASTTPAAPVYRRPAASPQRDSSDTGWRPVRSDEVFQPGGNFRMNQTTGVSEVREPSQTPTATASFLDRAEAALLAETDQGRWVKLLEQVYKRAATLDDLAGIGAINSVKAARIKADRPTRRMIEGMITDASTRLTQQFNGNGKHPMASKELRKAAESEAFSDGQEVKTVADPEKEFEPGDPLP